MTPKANARMAALPALLIALIAGGCATQPQAVEAPRVQTPAPAPVAAPAPAPVPAPAGHENLNATLWTQTAAEHDALYRQAYRAARERLDAALKDPSWTAVVEQEKGQTGDFAKLPPAIILDIDETVLDNSPYEAKLIQKSVSHTPALWKTWAGRPLAKALPGAVEFTKYAASKGVEVFFISNRDVEFKAPTRENLSAEGFPVKPDTVICRAERPEWKAGDKGARRGFVAKSYRVLLQVGDDLGDFVSGIDATPEKRAALAGEHASWWGERWIVLPNPMYGSWERAVLGDAKGDAEKLKRKVESVKAFE